jgi:hypothetical protein
MPGRPHESGDVIAIPIISCGFKRGSQQVGLSAPGILNESLTMTVAQSVAE